MLFFFIPRDRTAEPVSRDQIPRREWGQGNFNFPVELTKSRIGNHHIRVPVDAQFANCNDLTYITYIEMLFLGSRVENASFSTASRFAELAKCDSSS